MKWADPKRDQAIADDIKAGVGLPELVRKYGLSKGTIIGIGKKVEARRLMAEKIAADPYEISYLQDYLQIRNGQIIFQLRQIHGITRIDQLANYSRDQLPVSVGLDQIIEYAKTLGIHLKPSPPKPKVNPTRRRWGY